MIIKKQMQHIDTIKLEDCLQVKGDHNIFQNALYLDLEHSIYKIPLCIGVLGTCTYNADKNRLEVVQYMIENKQDAKDILYIAKDLFETKNSKYIITFAGENDFSVINFLFKKHKIKFDFDTQYVCIDLQKEYFKHTETIIGLKNLEKRFAIKRESELVSGSSLARTFQKIMKTPGYGERISTEKVDRILRYNYHDVVNLFHITTHWYKFIDE